MAHNASPQPVRNHTLFVYGTLKREFSNHYFLRNAVFIGPARTVERYGLYVDEFPFVYPRDAVCPIMGEVYKVDSDTLTRLDALEGHPRLYRREQIPVRYNSNEQVLAWIYFYPKRCGRLIASGEYKPSSGLGAEQR